MKTDLETQLEASIEAVKAGMKPAPVGVSLSPAPDYRVADEGERWYEPCGCEESEHLRAMLADAAKAHVEAAQQRSDKLDRYSRLYTGETPEALYSEPRDPLASFGAFCGDVLSRLQVGSRDYGDRSFGKDPRELIEEIRQELLDVCGWSYVLSERLRKATEALGAISADSTNSDDATQKEGK